MAEQPDFAFVTNLDPKGQRTRAGIRPNRHESDNGDFVAYAPSSSDTFPSDVSSSDQLLAASDKQVVARFWSHVDRRGAVHPLLGTRCWWWTANVVGRGHKTHPLNSRHGQFTYRVNGRPQRHIYAHRFAWIMAHGLIPIGLQVLHQCDCPPCVNVQHLFLGTQADNMKDAASKQRFTVPRTCVLSLFDRLQIFHAPPYHGICVDLARQYGVTKTAISNIRRGRFLGSGLWLGTKAPSERMRMAKAELR